MLLLFFPWYKVTHGQRYCSDRNPLLIQLETTQEDFTRRRHSLFRFEEHWTRESLCEERIKNVWKMGESWESNTKVVQRSLMIAQFTGVAEFERKINNLE